jgi:hypothetical protein
MRMMTRFVLLLSLCVFHVLENNNLEKNHSFGIRARHPEKSQSC